MKSGQDEAPLPTMRFTPTVQQAISEKTEKECALEGAPFFEFRGFRHQNFLDKLRMFERSSGKLADFNVSDVPGPDGDFLKELRRVPQGERESQG
jgi:hypothetical protein